MTTQSTDHLKNALEWLLRDYTARYVYAGAVLEDKGIEITDTLVKTKKLNNSNEHVKSLMCDISLNIHALEQKEEHEIIDVMRVLDNNIAIIKDLIQDITQVPTEKTIFLLSLVKDDFARGQQEKAVFDKVIARMSNKFFQKKQ